MTSPELDATHPAVRERRPSRSSDREISVLVRPDVALYQTKHDTTRRHLTRGLLRVLSLLSGDCVAAAASAAIVRAAAQWASGALGGGQGWWYPSTAEFCGAAILSLLLGGNYQRSDRPHSTLHLLMASALGVVVVYWSSYWASPSVGAVAIAALLAIVTTCTLFLTRGIVAATVAWALPDHRRLVPAIVLSSTGVEPVVAPRSGYRVAGRVALDRGHPEAYAQELARGIRHTRAESVIVFGSIDDRLFARCLEVSLNAGCEVLCTPPGHGVAAVRPSVIWRGPYDLIQVQSPTLKAPQMIAKRCVDVVLACVGLLVTAPLAAIVAIAIRLDSPGPVLFRQERVGLGGRRFQMFKFRTMRPGADAEKAGLAHLNATGDRRLFKIPDDPRISRVGGFLRQWSLDELPQLLNVLMGHMSLVGPRPFFEEDFADYEVHHFRRLGAKPGITGLWQVYGRSSVLDFEEVVRMDTEYIDRWSLWLDLKILLNTVPAVMRRTGAY